MRRLLLIVPVVALALAGCGDDGGGEATTVEAVDLIRSSSDAATEVGTAHMEMTVEGGVVSVDATGQLDFENQRLAMSMELPAPLESTFDIVVDGTTSYMSATAFGPVLPDVDAEWIRVDAEQLAEDSGVDVDQLTGGVAGNNPADLLAGLEGISEDGLEEVGTEELRGVETTHWSGEIDMDAALEQIEVPEGEDAIDQEAMDRFEEAYGGDPIPVDVWIDDEGLLHQLVMTISAEGQEVELTMEMFDYGEPVDIQVPDDADTVDFQELLDELGGD